MSERIRKFLLGIYPGTCLQFQMLRHYMGLPAAVVFGMVMIPMYWIILIEKLFKRGT